jgi:hypothetical protein
MPGRVRAWIAVSKKVMRKKKVHVEGRFEDGSPCGDDESPTIEGMMTMRYRAMFNILAVSAVTLAGSAFAANAEQLDASCRLEGRNLAICHFDRATSRMSPNWTLRACGTAEGCMRRSPMPNLNNWPADMILG